MVLIVESKMQNHLLSVCTAVIIQILSLVSMISLSEFNISISTQ